MQTPHELIQSLRPASFRGVEFYIDTETLSSGRNLIVDSYPQSDSHTVEDVGDQPLRWSVSAYLVGHEVEADALALVEQLRLVGAGGLVLPHQPSINARVEKWSRKFQTSSIGLLGFEIEFVEDDDISLTSTIDQAAAANARISQIFDSALSVWGDVGFSGTSGFVRDDMVANVVNLASSLDSVRSNVKMRIEGAAKLASTAGKLYRAGVNLDVFAIPGLIRDGMEAIGDVVQPRNTIDAFQTLAHWGSNILDPGTATTSRRQQRKNQNALKAVTRSTAIAHWAAAAAGADFDTREDAINTRANLVELSRQAMDSLDYPVEALGEIRGLVNFVADQISQKSTTIKPMLKVETNDQTNPLYLSQRIHGNASAAEEIIRMNDVPHPAFLPRELQVRARN